MAESRGCTQLDAELTPAPDDAAAEAMPRDAHTPHETPALPVAAERQAAEWLPDAGTGGCRSARSGFRDLGTGVMDKVLVWQLESMQAAVAGVASRSTDAPSGRAPTPPAAATVASRPRRSPPKGPRAPWRPAGSTPPTFRDATRVRRPHVSPPAVPQAGQREPRRVTLRRRRGGDTGSPVPSRRTTASRGTSPRDKRARESRKAGAAVDASTETPARPGRLERVVSAAPGAKAFSGRADRGTKLVPAGPKPAESLASFAPASSADPVELRQQPQARAAHGDQHPPPVAPKRSRRAGDTRDGMRGGSSVSSVSSSYVDRDSLPDAAACMIDVRATKDRHELGPMGRTTDPAESGGHSTGRISARPLAGDAASLRVRAQRSRPRRAELPGIEREDRIRTAVLRAMQAEEGSDDESAASSQAPSLTTSADTSTAGQRQGRYGTEHRLPRSGDTTPPRRSAQLALDGDLWPMVVQALGMGAAAPAPLAIGMSTPHAEVDGTARAVSARLPMTSNGASSMWQRPSVPHVTSLVPGSTATASLTSEPGDTACAEDSAQSHVDARHPYYMPSSRERSGQTTIVARECGRNGRAQSATLGDGLGALDLARQAEAVASQFQSLRERGVLG